MKLNVLDDLQKDCSVELLDLSGSFVRYRDCYGGRVRNVRLKESNEGHAIFTFKGADYYLILTDLSWANFHYCAYRKCGEHLVSCDSRISRAISYEVNEIPISNFLKYGSEYHEF